MKERENGCPRKQSKIRIILRILFIILLIFSIYKIGRWFIDNGKIKQQMQLIDDAVSVVSTDENNNPEELEIDFNKLKELNNDTVAYLIIKNTNINYPVVKSSDNEYYLYHSYDKKSNGAGWIYADYRNKLDGTDKNIIIYGHNRKDKSMFGTLNKTIDSSWNSNEDNIVFDLYRDGIKESYRIFSSYEIINEDDYLKTDFEGEEFIKYVNAVKKKSVKYYQTDVDNDDKILTLSTCGKTSNTRVVVHAVKIEKDD